jgi:hypothetical protein
MIGHGSSVAGQGMAQLSAVDGTAVEEYEPRMTIE